MRTSIKTTSANFGLVLGTVFLGGPFTVSLSAQEFGSIKNVATLKGHSQAVTSVAFSPDGKTLVSGSHDMTVKLWGAAGGKATATLKGHPSYVTFVAFDSEGKTVVSASLLPLQGDKGTVIFWEAATGKTIRTLSPELLVSVAMSFDGMILVTGCLSDFKLWDLKSGKSLATLKGRNSVDGLALSPDGKTLASNSDNVINLGDLKTCKNAPLVRGVGPLAYSPDGKILAFGTSLWDNTSKMKIADLLGHTGNVRCVAFSPDGKRHASGSSDKTILLWDVKSRKSIATLKGHGDDMTAVAFSLDGKMLASAGGKTIKLWNISGKDKQEKNPEPEPDAKESKPRATLGTGQDFKDGPQKLAFSPQGDLIA